MIHIDTLCRGLFFSTLIQSILAAKPFVVPWSTTKFGPDGPWQAVSIIVGGNDSSMYISAQKTAQVAVYPGGEFQSLTYTSAACSLYPNSFCGAGGTWNPDPYQAMQQYIAFSPSFVDNTTGLKTMNARSLALGLTINERTVWNATLASASSGNITYANGVVGGVPLGNLALGASSGAPEQFFTQSNIEVGRGINASIFAGRLYRDGDISSYSYGLHIGSAAFDYPGSLVFGGYNKGRVIEPVTSFEDSGAVELLDISIGVEYGESPFPFRIKDRLLPRQLKVKPDPLSPYLSLPAELCRTLASYLPVIWDTDLKYYLWNTSSPEYARIVTSPAYLAFSFPPPNGQTANVKIKAPFALLNLTLERPIVSKPTQYFPCMPYDTDRPVLGRAFLQAAFLGRNWEKQISWLAQAPGPGVSRRGLGDQNMDIARGAVAIEGWGGEGLFNSSWNGHWSVLASRTNVPVPETPRESEQPKQSGSSGADANTQAKEGISTGAKVGIAVGAMAVGVIALCTLGYFWRRKKRAHKVAEMTGTPYMVAPVEVAEKPQHDYYAGPTPWGEGRDRRMSELASPTSPVEMQDTSLPFRG
ncbi:hypothetical protein FB567DRAFT_530399 [Paraphoma chrysanthemicola]|uniref:Peptidase A1 domain-containing protein n=1 Tax=Paraphoma chrysanthemicola TaxID=798071 RepID=A0A8K0R2A6_9PLEO|nr:hypothetical protein FB567DRAFT_530399 [Paraphoma chrysanthemicola]